MDFSKYYNKLPKKIQNSEKFLYYSIKFSEFMRKFSKSQNNEANSYINFLLKSTNIKADGLLRDVQLLSVELMKFLDNVCKKYDLNYILAYGTLLGAVRHKGFIPWDDDLDIIMIRKDYNKLIEVLPSEINKNEFLRKNLGLTKLKNFNENYFEDTIHIYDKTYEDYFFKNQDYKQVFLQIACLKPFVKIDVFPHDFIKDDSLEEYRKRYLTQKYYFRMANQNKDFTVDKEVSNSFKKLGLTFNETEYIGESIDGTGWCDFGLFKKELMYPIKTIKFEDNYFKCPNNSHALLKHWFGESYMNLPPKVDMHEFVEYNLLLFENDEEELSNAFKNMLNKLKEINDNFEY